jgi:hypothetical protein
MNLTKLLLTTFTLTLIQSAPTPTPSNDGFGNLLNHKTGDGGIVNNAYMHTIGHVFSDIPDYLATLAKGDLVGFITKLLRFVVYHNPVNLAADFGGGQLLNAVNGASNGGHKH